VEDLAWVVQAIRIQQTVGGKLADLLFTLAEFMRGREEIRREVKVLTAEGRMSAWVLGALPVGLFFAIKTMSPGYLDPMFRGGGLVALIGAGVCVAIVAGASAKVGPEEFVVMQGVGLGAGVLLGLLVAQTSGYHGFGLIRMVVILAGMGVFAPVAWLRRKQDERQGSIRRDLPDVLDLLAIPVEACV